jgi:hypothetical protein
MTCSLYRLANADIDKLIEDPRELDRMLGFDQGPPVREVRPKGILGFLLRLTPITISEVDPDAAESSYEVDPEKTIDVEKAWHGLHFLLTGTSEEGTPPASYLLNGGEDVDDEGLTRAIRPEHVKHFAEFLDELNPEILAKRFDPGRMMELEIYPEIWDRDPSEDDTLQWLLSYFVDLKVFVKRVAKAGDGLVIHTST